MRGLHRYYRRLFGTPIDAVPEDHETLVFFSLLQIVALWNTPTSVTASLGEFIVGKPTERPSKIISAIAKNSSTVRLALLLWPLLAVAMSVQPGIRRWYANWRAALVRPDLFLHVGPGPYDPEELRGLVSGIASVGVGQLLRVAVAPDGFALDDKRHFAEQAARAGLKAVPGLSAADLDRSREYIVKPAVSFQGADVRRTSAANAAPFCGDPEFVVQDVLRNHACIRKLVGEDAATSTIRVSTVRSEGRTVVVGAVFRMGVQGSVVDNLHAGGLAAPIDLKTGCLGAAATAEMFRVGWKAERYERHPATNERVLGWQLPDFELAVQLCIEAHDALASDLFRMGWDVVLTDDGPWLLEANCVFDGNFLTDLERSDVILGAMRDAIARSLNPSR